MLLRLINDIVDLSCIESNTITYYCAVCDMNELINELYLR